MGPGALSEILNGLPKLDCPDLLVGNESNDDALIYKLTDDIAVAQTVDFFPPMVDDPYLFGQIAAANALSDIYAMGAKPVVAMNLLCLPSCLDAGIAREILRGGADKAIEAGCVIAGGHTLVDSEPKYGLCVTGLVHPSRILTNSGARPGDKLILTKKIGTGAITTALKAGLLPEDQASEAFESMRALNKTAMEIAAGFDINACTDITGFGLGGHAREMAQGSGVSFIIYSGELPLLPHAPDLAAKEILPGGMDRNLEYFISGTIIDEGVNQAVADLFFDPQTSGGLLLSVPAPQADILLGALRERLPAATVIGEVVEKQSHFVYLR